ncbi:MAG: tRNA uridine-5-carboxymethylaminomethyl(34) synthesis GTPase MnmE [Mycoplasma sp.]
MKTIASITTPLITSAIHIIRVSGPDAFNIVNKICQTPIKVIPNTIQRNKIVFNEEIIDDVLLNVFVAPKSFTGENSIEINCHGSTLVTKKILDALIISGCEQAGPGEFSMQALINKKMDYAQIEAMNNFINSNNEMANRFSYDAMQGKWSKKIEEIRTKIFKITGSIEVNIDYPEYDDVPQLSHKEIVDILEPLIIELNSILTNSKKILPIFDGIKVGIIGEPNVGKSSLLNLLSKQEKAIVSNIEGTTRDCIESNISFNGVSIKLIDTAGIRDTNDAIESMGIDKTKSIIDSADLIIWLNDASKISLNKSIENLLKDKQHIIAYNKSDLAFLENKLMISVKENEIGNLLDAIEIKIGSITNIPSQTLILQSERQINFIEKIISILNDLVKDLKSETTLDLLQSDFERVIELFNKILGYNFDYDKLDELFKNFCLGK